MMMGLEAKTVEEQKTPEEPERQEKPKTEEELRRAPRLTCSGLAGIQTLPACEKPFPARIANLSVGGCLMELQEPHSFFMGEIVELIFRVNYKPFRVRGKVRAIRSETLVGFQFPQLSERVRRQLEDLIGELIEHLAQLHRESIANRPAQEDAKLAQFPAALAARSGFPCHPMRPADVQHSNAVNRPEPHRRWL